MFHFGFHKLTKDGYPIYIQEIEGILNMKRSSKLILLIIYQIMLLNLLKQIL